MPRYLIAEQADGRYVLTFESQYGQDTLINAEQDCRSVHECYSALATEWLRGDMSPSVTIDFRFHRDVHYVVIESTPGYLPEDDDPAVFDSIDDAMVYASDRLSSLLDHIVDGQSVVWTPEGGWQDANPVGFEVNGSFAESGSVLVYDKSREHDLGRVIRIVETDANGEPL